jgi:cell division protein FtsW
MRKKKVSNVNTFDRKLFILAFLLTFLGLLAVADSSAPLAIRNFADKFFYARQQAVGAFLGLAVMIILSRINYKFWEKIATPLFFLSVLSLVLVFVPGLGIKVLGASRWVKIGFLTFQPSEIVKFSLVIYLAKVFSKGKKIASYLAPVVLVSAIIMLQPDLGTTAIIVSFSMAQVFVSGVDLLRLAVAGIVGISGLFVLILTSGYRKERLMTFLKETKNPLDEGYHIRQILLALGSGGFWGVGLGQSRQKFLFLPETATDSIFAVIAEEVGFLGSGVLILLFAFFVVRGISIAKKAPDKFSFLLATGITSWIGVQIFLNIASMVALVPLTGIPLPFFSFGGTALVMILSATGILLNISRYAKA